MVTSCQHDNAILLCFNVKLSVTQLCVLIVLDISSNKTHFNLDQIRLNFIDPKYGNDTVAEVKKMSNKYIINNK